MEDSWVSVIRDLVTPYCCIHIKRQEEGGARTSFIPQVKKTYMDIKWYLTKRFFNVFSMGNPAKKTLRSGFITIMFERCLFCSVFVIIQEAFLARTWHRGNRLLTVTIWLVLIPENSWQLRRFFIIIIILNIIRLKEISVRIYNKPIFFLYFFIEYINKYIF